MAMQVTILGSNSAAPSRGRFPTAQVLNIEDKLYLIDCGEGAQIQMERFNIRRSKIDYIFISHLHGDHFFGLIGLLVTFSLNRRNKEIHIFAAPPLKQAIDLLLLISNSTLTYGIIYHDIVPLNDAIIFENNDVVVQTIALEHRIETVGFIFREKPKLRKLIKSKIEEYAIPIAQLADLKKGIDFITNDGKIIENATLTMNPTHPKSYAFCSDTLYLENIIPYIKGVDLLYHEATFLHSFVSRAEQTCHSTAHQAATIAKKADVKKLIIGHFSSRYANLTLLLDEARATFEETYLAIEGETFII